MGITGIRGRRALLLGLGGVAIGGLARPAVAQGWPVRPPRFIIPYGAGNQADIIARLLGDALGTKWGQRPVMENVPGAGGALGVAQIARAAPDGYTFGIIAIAALAITPHMAPAPYDPLNDLLPLASASVARSALVVSATLPPRSLVEFVAFARSRPNDPLFFGSPGTGTVPHLATEMLCRALGITATHVPYRTSAAGMADLVAGRVQFGVDSLTVTLPHIEGGRLRALVSNAASRLPALPDTPALPEAAPGLDLPNAWQSLQGPRGFPPEIAARIAADVAALLADPAFLRRFPAGTDPFAMTQAETAALIRRDHARFGALVREMDLREG
jgi:tripartite-type tricarboxylate transporter receptor subunit TctC